MSKAFAQHSAAFYDGLYKGRSLRDMAKEFGVSHVAISKWRARVRKGEIPGVRRSRPEDATDNPLINIVRQRRLQKGLTMEQTAVRAAMHKTQICYIERGRREPYLRTWLALIEALGGEVTVRWSDDTRANAA